MLHWWYQERSQHPHYGVFRVPGRWPLLLCTYRTDPHRESRTNRGKISIFRSNAQNTILPRFYFSAIRNYITLKRVVVPPPRRVCFTTIRNYITLKQVSIGILAFDCFTTIRNYITLKRCPVSISAGSCFTTIRNYITLKLGYTTTFNSSGRGLIFFAFSFSFPIF